MVRKLRLAGTVFFGVAAVTLCVIWVRSYWTASRLMLQLPADSLVVHCLGIENAELSCEGGHIELFTNLYGGPIGFPIGLFFNQYEYDAELAEEEFRAPEFSSFLGAEPVGSAFFIDRGFYFYTFDHRVEMIFPIWIAVSSVAGFSAIAWYCPLPQMPSRFSLRVAFIVTTFVALLLGLGVWLGS